MLTILGTNFDINFENAVAPIHIYTSYTYVFIYVMAIENRSESTEKILILV